MRFFSSAIIKFEKMKKQKMKRFENQVIVITGGSKGIGWAAAEQFLAEGGKVSIWDIHAPEGEELARNSNHLLWVKCDVSKEKDIQGAVETTEKQWGNIQILVCSAGIQRYSTVTETSEEEWDFVMGINLKGSFLAAKHCIPSMQRHGNGAVILISSVQAFYSQDKVAPYVASKSGQIGLMRSIAVDYAPNIRCVAVCPGTINTPMLRDAINLSPDPAIVLKECEDMHLVQRIGEAEEVSKLICFLASSEASFITGQYFRIDGGLGVMIAGSKK
jgi:NAD(P)-dependent dehydrogenase (short-subunit alcohol dehydrogenase family)